MSYETLDNIVRQGTELGTFLYIFSGGEPMVRKADILKLCQAHPDCMFLAFTNGTLIDEDFADGMLRVKNFVPAISIEGFEEATDGRRGHGTYQAVVKTMRLLQSKKLPFGVSCCYTSQNIDSLSSEEFFDSLIADGAKFAWFFHYMPVGNDAVTQLLPLSGAAGEDVQPHPRLPEHQAHLHHRLPKRRGVVGGCIAGDGGTSTSTPTGDMEPCAFIHYSDSSVYDKTLLEALKSPLFMAYHDGQPFNENMFRPLPHAGEPGQAPGDGGKERGQVHGHAVPRARGKPDEEVPALRGELDSHRRQAVELLPQAQRVRAAREK